MDKSPNVTADHIAQASNSEVENVLNGLIDKADQLNVKLYGKLSPYTEELTEKESETDSAPFPSVYYTQIGQKIRLLDELLDNAHRKINRAQL